MASIDALPLPRVYLRGMTERTIEDLWPHVLSAVEETGASWVWMVSDDVIVRRHVLSALRQHRRRHPVVTGYSQRTHADWTVNLTWSPLRGDAPSEASYDFLSYRQVVAHPRPTLDTWFAGMSMTGMSVEMWREFPFACFGWPGWGSDFALSKRLQDAGIPIVAVREALCYHYRVQWQNTSHPDDQAPETGNPEIVVVER